MKKIFPVCLPQPPSASRHLSLTSILPLRLVAPWKAYLYISSRFHGEMEETMGGEASDQAAKTE